MWLYCFFKSYSICYIIVVTLCYKLQMNCSMSDVHLKHSKLPQSFIVIFQHDLSTQFKCITDFPFWPIHFWKYVAFRVAHHLSVSSPANSNIISYFHLAQCLNTFFVSKSTKVNWSLLPILSFFPRLFLQTRWTDAIHIAKTLKDPSGKQYTTEMTTAWWSTTTPAAYLSSKAELENLKVTCSTIT